ncbi:phage protein NinX family protein [Proteus penneri]|uniref:phage protein NinX family protein n=1 Tax=Proteus penneri TaxID=102862 RepID=UPI0034D5204D
MNKYTELSDFEINLLVAQSVLPETQYDVIKQTMDIIQFLVDGSFGYRFFDPCNNPTDAMPIIIENLISLMADMSDDRGSTWWCASDISNGITSRYKSNPLRAAMEVFLMMKDAENEN